MSKNLTRKGLALGAVVALGTSLFAGAPASAAASLSVVADTGTGFTVLASDSFTVRTLGVDYTVADTSNLFYKITKPSSVVPSYTLTNEKSGYGSTTPVATISTGNVDYIKSGAVGTVGNHPKLNINPAIGATGVSQSFTVEAFIESGDADGLDAKDLVKAPAVTINFVKDLASTITLDQVSVGQDVTGTVKYNNADFNYGQSALTNTYVLVKKNAELFTAHASQSVTRATGNTNFEFDSSVLTVAAGDVVAAKTDSNGWDSSTARTNSPVVYSTADAASDATGYEDTITRSENIKLATGASPATDWVVRTGTKAFTYRVDFTKASGVQAVAAGKAVQITVTETGTDTVTTSDVIRVNGKKIAATLGNSDSALVNTVTDATGGVTITVENDTALVGDAIQINVKATGTSVLSANKFTWTDAALTSFTATNAQLGADRQTVLKGSTVTLKYAARDQFGKLWTKAGSTYRAQVTKGGTGTLILDTTVDVINGEATLTYTDNSTAASSALTVSADLQVKTTGDFADAGLNPVVTNLNVVTVAQAASKITVSAATKGNGTGTVSSTDGVASDLVTRADKTLAAIDLRSNANGVATGVTAANSAKLTGTVYNADGSAASGVEVTVAAAGLFFGYENTANTYLSANSIKVNTNVDGSYEVYAFSAKGGSFAITITSGSVVKTQNVKYAAADANSGKTLTITAPANSLPGRAVDVVVLLVDKYGAPVTTTAASPISVSLTGVGYPTTIATNTDANGKIAFKLVLGATEVGTATITAKYDADDAGTTYLPITTVATINVSTTLPTAAATAAVSGSTGKFYVSATNAAAKKVVVKVAGKFFRSFTGTAAKKTVALKAPKGKHKVTVFVGGKLVTTKTITVK